MRYKVDGVKNIEASRVANASLDVGYMMVCYLHDPLTTAEIPLSSVTCSTEQSLAL
jgi:hypothetical protein